ncbi:MAG: 50S ribosomal protein L23, partial [Flavobacteriales bacterium]
MSVLKKPLITEKMTKTSEKLGQYGFIVDRNANKVQIKKAVEKMYNVSVDSVNTLTIAGKRKTRYTKTGFVSGSTGTFKKA